MPLTRLRAERDQMSAIERRIADFVVENAHFLRDYSSQQLANALGVSQSSVVKFCQKLGYKGYPDLKFSVGEAVARTQNGHVPVNARVDAAPIRRPDGLWRRKAQAEEETRALNAPETLDAVADAIAAARTIYAIGLGEDDIPARMFALRMRMLGIRIVQCGDVAEMSAAISATEPGDVLLVFSAHGNDAALCQLCRHFHTRGGIVVSATRHNVNAVRARANIALAVYAHDDLPYIDSLLYHSALQHVMDGVFVRLCQADEARQALLQRYYQPAHPALEG